jgi:hypothetical protein
MKKQIPSIKTLNYYTIGYLVLMFFSHHALSQNPSTDELPNIKNIPDLSLSIKGRLNQLISEEEPLYKSGIYVITEKNNIIARFSTQYFSNDGTYENKKSTTSSDAFSLYKDESNYMCVICKSGAYLVMGDKDREFITFHPMNQIKKIEFSRNAAGKMVLYVTLID